MSRKFVWASTPNLLPVDDTTDEFGYVKVADNIVYTFRDKDYFFDYTVHAGFVSDGASIPRALWSWLGGKFTPKAWRAFLFHDWCYAGETDLTRKEADAALRDILVHDGFSATKAKLMYYGVRLFGGKWWDGAKMVVTLASLAIVLAGCEYVAAVAPSVARYFATRAVERVIEGKSDRGANLGTETRSVREIGPENAEGARICPQKSDGEEPRAEAYIIPNEKGGSLEQYRLSVDEVEEATGLDFFNLLPDELEDSIESRPP